MKLKRLIYLIIGCICLALGCVGSVLPILPTVPFFLATVFCFAKSSKKLHDWFIDTKTYKNHLESFVRKKGMTVCTKAAVLTSITLLMGTGFILMSHVPVGRVILAIVWLAHVIYLLFGIQTIKS